MFLHQLTIRRLMCVTVAGFLFVAAGCRQVERADVRASFELPETFSSTGTEPLPEQWWQSFNDPNLNVLIEQALSDNFTIRSAWDRLTQAEQIAIRTGASLYPSVSYQVGASRTRQEIGDRTVYASEYSAGLAASYEIDLWGRIQSSKEAATMDVKAAQESVTTAAMTISAAIAKTWYQLAEAKQKSRVIAQQYETNNKVLKVIQLQFRQGQAKAADVFRQQQLAESSRGQYIQNEETVVLLAHQLSVLIGKPPGNWWADESIDLIPLGQMPTVDVPAVVIQRRPDVRAAYNAVLAADYRAAVAIADQYPAISLSGVVETSSSKAHDLFDDWLANLAANLTGPLFDAGLRKAEVRRTQAVLSERLNDYSQLVLESLQEVEDAISQEYYQRQYVENLQQQLTLSRQVYERTRQNYIKGQIDYIRVLESLVSQQTLERNELTARRTLIDRRIDLCRAIASGWALPRPAPATLEQND